MNMTNRERFLKTLNHEEPDRIPFGKVDFCGTLLKIFKEKTGASDPDEFFNIPTRMVGGWASGGSGAMVGGSHLWKGDIDYSDYIPDIPDEGKLMVKADGYLIGENDLEVYLYPMKNFKEISDLHSYPWWEAERKASSNRSWQDLKQEVDSMQDRDLFVLGWVGNTFESAWKLRGFENFLMDMYKNQEFAEELLDLCTEACINNVRYVAQAGVDILFFYDDIAMDTGLLLSKDMFRKFLLPRYKKIIDEGRAIIPNIPTFFHTDGKATDMIPLIIEAGFTILNPIQPECMDPIEVKKEFGDEITFWGTIGVQQLMPFGTPNDIKNEVKNRILTIGKGGGFVISPAQTLYSDIPWENVTAFFEAVKEYGGLHLE